MEPGMQRLIAFLARKAVQRWVNQQYESSHLRKIQFNQSKRNEH